MAGDSPSQRPKHPQSGSDHQFRVLVDGVIDYAIFMLDERGYITSWNRGARRLKGYSADEIIGQHFSVFYTAEARAAGEPARALHTATTTGKYEAEGWRVRKDGSRFFANVVIDAIHDSAGTLIGFAKVTRDTTERLAAQEALRLSEERFRLLIRGVSDYAIYMLDPQGRIVNWNTGGERIKGYTEDEIIGRHFSVFYTEEDRAAGVPARALETAEREGKYEAEAWRVRKDGSRFWASVVLDAIRDGDGKLLGFAKITRDMTERKKAEDALNEARAALMQVQKMEVLGQLTGGVAHDFNNLLTVVVNNLDLLARPSVGEPEKRRLIASAQRAAERGSKLTQQLLAFARRQPLRPLPHDINRIIGGFEAVLRRAVGETISVTLNLTHDPGVTLLDSPQFEAALLNLVVNARDAMPDGGKVTISTAVVEIAADRARKMSGMQPGRSVAVTVTDTGAGMSPEVRERAFEPFYTTKDVGKGSGLGLSQVYGFVIQSGGHVELASGPGRGTAVTIYLPTAKGEAAELPQAAAAQRRKSAGTVLIVEDDPDVLDSAVSTLRSLGYDVLTAGDGESALATLTREQEIDVLFSDIVMPRGMNGVELARRACSLRPRLKVLLASGYPMSSLSTEHGFNEQFSFLSKPYRWTELQDRLRAMAAAG